MVNRAKEKQSSNPKGKTQGERAKELRAEGISDISKIDWVLFNAMTEYQEANPLMMLPPLPPSEQVVRNVIELSRKMRVSFTNIEYKVEDQIKKSNAVNA